MQTPTPKRFAPLDVLVTLTVLAGGAAAIPALMRAPEATSALVYVDNSMVAELPLDHDAGTVIAGAEGPMEIRVADGTVRVVRSACRRQICVHSGPAGTPGQQIICVPNHVVVEVRAASREDELDAVTQ